MGVVAIPAVRIPSMGDHVHFTSATRRRFRSVLCSVALALPLAIAGCAHQHARTSSIADVDDELESSQPPLVTGRFLADHLADAAQDVGSLPMNMVPSPDGRYVLTTDMGSRQALCVIRTSDGKATGRTDF